MALDANGAIGGLSILWNPNLATNSIFVASRNMLSSYFHILGTSVWGVITNVYGPFQLVMKPTFLEEVHFMKDQVEQAHQLIGGDFNLIHSLEEKKGGIRTLSRLSTSFNMLIEDFNLVDVQTPNGIYTWQNKRSGMRHIASHLDRFLVQKRS